MTTPRPAPPRTELNGLRRASIVVLQAIRLAGGLLGLAVTGLVCWQVVQETSVLSGNALPRHEALVHAALGCSFGLPLLLPLLWLRRLALWLLPLFAVLWFGPIWLPDLSPYGFILRVFATGVAITALVLWNLLLSLTSPTIRE